MADANYLAWKELLIDKNHIIPRCIVFYLPISIIISSVIITTTKKNRKKKR